MRPGESRVLVIGFGNPGRLDDGLGPAAAAELEVERPYRVTVDADYQLTVEHAASIARHDACVLIDAAAEGPEPFAFERVRPGSTETFSTHAVEPSALAGLVRELFGAETETWILGIRGYEFDGFGERLSPRATRNLDAALGLLRRALETRDFASARDEARAVAAAAAGGATGGGS